MENLTDYIKQNLSECCINVTNASPSNEYTGSMIEYWEEQTKIDLSKIKYQCPKCKSKFERSDLDGAHVVKVSSVNNQPQYITPLCQDCNRGKDETPFNVPEEYLVVAP